MRDVGRNNHHVTFADASRLAVENELELTVFYERDLFLWMVMAGKTRVWLKRVAEQRCSLATRCIASDAREWFVIRVAIEPLKRCCVAHRDKAS